MDKIVSKLKLIFFKNVIQLSGTRFTESAEKLVEQYFQNLTFLFKKQILSLEI